MYRVDTDHVIRKGNVMKMISLGSAEQMQDKNSRSKGWIVSLATHIVFLGLLCLPFIVTRIPEPEPEGLMVNLGLQDQGQGEETPKGETDKVSAEPTPSKPQPVLPLPAPPNKSP